jgi:hypothetical protein
MPEPIVSSVSPSLGALIGGTEVVIAGTGFNGATNVFFGGIPVTTFNIDSDVQITATAPMKVDLTSDAGTTAIVAVGTNQASMVLTNSGKTAYVFFGLSPLSISISSGMNGITLYQEPQGIALSANLDGNSVSCLAPGSLSLGDANGSGLDFASNPLNFSGGTSGSAVNPLSVSVSQDVASGVFYIAVPNFASVIIPGLAEAVDITVTTSNGTSAISDADQFIYSGAPVVAAISPPYGTSNDTTLVNITGVGFTGATAVSIGEASSPFWTISDTSVIAQIPCRPGFTGALDIQVTTASGTSAVCTADQFTYYPLGPVPTCPDDGEPIYQGQPPVTACGLMQVPPGVNYLITEMNFCNTTDAAATLTLYKVPVSGNASGLNVIYDNITVTPGHPCAIQDTVQMLQGEFLVGNQETERAITVTARGFKLWNNTTPANNA